MHLSICLETDKRLLNSEHNLISWSHFSFSSKSLEENLSRNKKAIQFIQFPLAFKVGYFFWKMCQNKIDSAHCYRWNSLPSLSLFQNTRGLNLFIIWKNISSISLKNRDFFPSTYKTKNFSLPAVISDCHSSISISPLNFKSSGISRKLLAGVWMAKVFSPIRQRQVISDKLKCSLFLSFVPKIDNVPNSISPPAWEPVCSSSILQFSHLPPLANRVLAAPLRTQEALSMAGS